MKNNTQWKNKGGVYKITNLIDGTVYVGSSKDLYERCSCHTRRALGQPYHKEKLYQAIRNYGLENFQFEVLEFVENEAERISRENEAISFYAEKGKVYNKERKAKIPYKFSEADIEKMKLVHKSERTYNKETKQFDEPVEKGETR